MAKSKPKKPAAKGKPSAKGKKPASSKPAKPARKPMGKKAAPKPAPKKAPKAAPKPPKPPPVKPAPGKPVPAMDKGGGKKGITVVTQKPAPRRAKPKPPALSEFAKVTGQLLPPGGPTRKPLIASGAHAAKGVPIGSHAAANQAPPPAVDGKSPLPKKELDRFRALLIKKRGELVGDVANMETEALKSSSGGLSHTPQHLAEQGSDAYDQSLALDLAAADRKLIKEIDDALVRIEKGTFGLCEVTGKPISMQRLEELPWARHSIEAARHLERRGARL
ncbi:MAG: TraR/DksA family transcriptional regulator [Phycisphaerae bacterium]|nr:TraR/DksA family transcriptional regulator [Phycisphaerae bacterium]